MPTTSVWIICISALLVAAAIVAFRNRGGRGGWWTRRRETRRRILAEDALKHIHDHEWRGQTATLDSLIGSLRCSPRRTIELIARLEGQGWIRSTADALTLTPEGGRVALQVIRAHRLWERYLADEARMGLTELHGEAERREHSRAADALDALDAALGHPTMDPHGDPIPTANGELARVKTDPVTDWPVKTPCRIVHIEDEPSTVFAQIAALGLRPGQIVRVMEADAKRIVLSDGHDRFVMAPIVAGNVFVAPARVQAGELAPTRRLTALRRGQSATVRGLDDALRGFTRRRLLDLGITRGATIKAVMSSMAGDPTAYHVRGSLIALREDQARFVLIGPGGNGNTNES